MGRDGGVVGQCRAVHVVPLQPADHDPGASGAVANQGTCRGIDGDPGRIASRGLGRIGQEGARCRSAAAVELDPTVDIEAVALDLIEAGRILPIGRAAGPNINHVARIGVPRLHGLANRGAGCESQRGHRLAAAIHDRRSDGDVAARPDLEAAPTHGHRLVDHHVGVGIDDHVERLIGCAGRQDERVAARERHRIGSVRRPFDQKRSAGIQCQRVATPHTGTGTVGNEKIARCRQNEGTGRPAGAGVLHRQRLIGGDGDIARAACRVMQGDGRRARCWVDRQADVTDGRGRGDLIGRKSEAGDAGCRGEGDGGAGDGARLRPQNGDGTRRRCQRDVRTGRAGRNQFDGKVARIGDGDVAVGRRRTRDDQARGARIAHCDRAAGRREQIDARHLRIQVDTAGGQDNQIRTGHQPTSMPAQRPCSRQLDGAALDGANG